MEWKEILGVHMSGDGSSIVVSPDSLFLKRNDWAKGYEEERILRIAGHLVMMMPTSKEIRKMLLVTRLPRWLREVAGSTREYSLGKLAKLDELLDACRKARNAIEEFTDGVSALGTILEQYNQEVVVAAHTEGTQDQLRGTTDVTRSYTGSPKPRCSEVSKPMLA